MAGWNRRPQRQWEKWLIRAVKNLWLGKNWEELTGQNWEDLTIYNWEDS